MNSMIIKHNQHRTKSRVYNPDILTHVSISTVLFIMRITAYIKTKKAFSFQPLVKQKKFVLYNQVSLAIQRRKSKRGGA